MRSLTRWFAVLAVLLAQPAVVYSQTTGLPGSNWCRHGAMDRPAQQQSVLHGAGLESSVSLPLGDGASFAEERDPMVGASVIRLRDSVCPSAVPLFVVPIVIGKTIQAEAFGTWSHILQERGKAGTPFLAHGDPAPTVVLVARLFLVEAPGFRCGPGLVLTCTTTAVAVLDATNCIHSQTATAFRVAGTKTSAQYHDYSPAVAPAVPGGSFLRWWLPFSAFDNREPTPCLTGHVDGDRPHITHIVGQKLSNSQPTRERV